VLCAARSRAGQVPSLDDIESFIQQQCDAVSRHTVYLNDLHSRCTTLQTSSASCLRGLPIVCQLLQVPSLNSSSRNHRPLTFFQALEDGREARARALRSAELAALRAAERRAAAQPPPQMDEFIRLTQLLRCFSNHFQYRFCVSNFLVSQQASACIRCSQCNEAFTQRRNNERACRLIPSFNSNRICLLIIGQIPP
jgi:hypothetical protein